MYGKNCNLRTLSREYDCLAKIGTKEAFTERDIVTGKLGQTSKGNRSRLELTIKDKNICKKIPFVADFGCNRQIWFSFNDCDDICDPK